MRRTHLMATFLPVCRCVPRQTVANDPDLSYESMKGKVKGEFFRFLRAKTAK